MKTLRLVLLLIAAAACAARADIPPGWGTDYPLAVATAQAAQHPVLVYFTASWCGPCKLMTRTTLADPPVQQVISGIGHVGVDIDQHQDIATQYGVNAVPTFILLSSGGDEVERTTGYQATADFLKWLNNSISEAQAAAAAKAIATQKLATVDQLLVATGTDSVQQAAANLFDLCDERDAAIVKSAAARLASLAARNPSALLDGLNDHRLATRIQVANVLEAKIGEKFDIDPWSDPATREKAVQSWRRQLAGVPGS